MKGTPSSSQFGGLAYLYHATEFSLRTNSHTVEAC